MSEMVDRHLMRLAALALAGWGLLLQPVCAAELRLEGSVTQGGLVVGRTVPGAVVTVDGVAVRVSDEGVFLVGFGRDAGERTRLVVELPGCDRQERVLEVARRDYRIQRIDGLPDRKVSPRAEDLERIRRDAALVRAARARDDARTDFLTGFVWPTLGPITGVYGSQRILNGQPRRPHYGVDIAGATGRVTGAHLDWRMNLGAKRLDPTLLVPPMDEARKARPGQDLKAGG
jgi:murein DD-endopeptidase MepM/ murein hydrolase activator NlpD